MTFNPSLQYFAQVVSHKLKNDPERLKRLEEAKQEAEDLPPEPEKNKMKAQE